MGMPETKIPDLDARAEAVRLGLISLGAKCGMRPQKVFSFNALLASTEGSLPYRREVERSARNVQDAFVGEAPEITIKLDALLEEWRSIHRECIVRMGLGPRGWPLRQDEHRKLKAPDLDVRAEDVRLGLIALGVSCGIPPHRVFNFNSNMASKKNSLSYRKNVDGVSRLVLGVFREQSEDIREQARGLVDEWKEIHKAFVGRQGGHPAEGFVAAVVRDALGADVTP